MDTARLRTAIEALLAADPDCLDGEELESAVRASSEVRSWLDAYEMRCARRSRQLADAGHAPPPESLLGTAGRRSGKDATTVTERDRVCTATPRFEAALTEGTVSAGHLDALANATRRLDDELRSDYATLVRGLHANSVCETVDGVPLPVSTVRRMCCDANIVPAVLGSNGEILDVGRAERTANRAQRRALRAMHRTCAHPDCTVGFSACRIHHVKWWWRDLGDTDIANLLPLCERHHHLVHEGGWGLTMTPDRVATWTRPDGTVHSTGTTIDRAPHGIATPRAGSPALTEAIPAAMPT